MQFCEMASIYFTHPILIVNARDGRFSKRLDTERTHEAWYQGLLMRYKSINVFLRIYENSESWAHNSNPRKVRLLETTFYHQI